MARILNIHPVNVLWRTRGRDWDYTFVLVPQVPAQLDWYDVHTTVFRDLAPRREPASRYGRLTGLFFSYPYVATAFLDPLLKDEAERAVAHYLVWFPQPEDDLAVPPALPLDWGLQLVESLAPARETLFARTLPEVETTLSRDVVIPTGALSPIDDAHDRALQKKN